MLERFASKLINYVEPAYYNGVIKTSFYSEFGTNFQIGDKVFIINGNYDSDQLITSSTYTLGTDGYNVLDIDRCRITLDIDFTGVPVYNQDDLSNYIKLHSISSQQEFDYINTLTTNSYATQSSRFEYGLTNNLIYAVASFSGTSSILAANNGITESGFYQKSVDNWINITATFSSGTIYFRTSGAGITYSLTNNNKILVVGENIILGTNSQYTQRGIYVYDNITNSWTLDNTSNKSFISKLNFRNGKFKGIWNDGVFGSYDKSIDWDSTYATWNSGVFLNSDWKLGTINSRNNKTTTTQTYTNGLYDASFALGISSSYNLLTYQVATVSRTIDHNSPIKQADNTIQQSYYCALDSFGNPLQSTDFSNNKGYGFNYIIDSIIETGTIVNGNFENCNIGLTTYGVNSLDVYYGLSYSYNIQACGGNYNLCDINTVALENSSIINSIIINSNINNTKLSSNQIVNTAAKGDYSANSGINVINADLWSYIVNDQKRGVLKLFIDSNELTRISNFEAIYINRINKEIYLSSFDDDSKVYLNYENKYILDYFNNSELGAVTIGSGTAGVITSGTIGTTVSFGGSGYFPGDLFAINGISTGIYRAQGTVLTTSAGAVETVTITYGGSLYAVSNAITTDTLTGGGSGLAIDILSVYNINTTNINSIVVSAKNVNENLYKSYISLSGGTYSNTYTSNPNQYASIDIDLGENLAWYVDGTSSYYINSKPVITTDNVSSLFSNTQINNSDFKSGILVNSNWNSGDNFNDISNKIVQTGGSYSIKVQTGSTNSITIDISDSIYNKYNDLNIGDYIWINGLDYATSSTADLTNIDFSARFKVYGTTTSVLPSSRRFILKEETNIINSNSLTQSGNFRINNLSPTYVSINKFKIDNTNITSGIFKNTLIVNSSIINSDFNNLDKTLTVGNVSKLRFINILFKNDNNNINSGLIYKSHILNTTWNNGLAFNSIVKGNSFSNGLFKNGYWIDGAFNNGVFSDSTAKITSTSSYELSSNYRSWRQGVFNNGQFYNSIWIDGVWNNGRLYSSIWYAGIWNNGILGIKNSQYYNTTMGYYANIGTGSTSTTWNYGIVESAIVGGSSSVYWNNGKFNDGEFRSNGGSYSSIWYNGDFNGGKFDGYAKWKNGYFNKGKFLSYYGWTLSNSTSSTDYSWEAGKFNGGQFGFPSTGTNSTWFNGEFNDGYFYGRVWNYGIFTKGNFFGSATTSVSFASQSKTEYEFVNGFTNSYYGLWRDGYVVDSVHLGNPVQKIYTDIKRSTDSKKVNTNAILRNVLWLNGTFSHASGSTENVVWLDGSFLRGNFNNSSFNPFVDRTLAGSTSSSNFSFNYDSCKWHNGTFDGGTFYISEWKDGLFKNGYMLGGVWRNGVWNYGSAENCYWGAGTWRNGNWYGTNFDYKTIGTASHIVIDPLTKNVLYNIASVIGTSSIHLLNAFTGSLSAEKLYDASLNREPSDYRGWTQTGSQPWSWSTTYTRDTGYSSILYNDNNYSFVGSGQSNTLFGLSASGGGFATDIFEPNTAYNISVSLFVDYPMGVYTYPTEVKFFLGYTTSTVNCGLGWNTYYFNLDADVSLWSSYNPKFGITKLGGLANSTTVLLDLSVKGTNVSYNFTNNNKLYTSYGITPSLTATVSFPGLVLTTIGSSIAGSGLVSLQYGNGKFMSGVWENGIWNNGWRDDTSLTKCVLYTSASYVRMSKNLHRIQLQFVTQNQSIYNVGDYVSVGNVVSIDINGQRKLIKDKYKVVFIGVTNIVLEIVLNYPIQQIIQDSDLHLIYLSKNVWLSGGFLNGYFTGIWNYGLFKGFPYITYMKDSHMIDGLFDGGHFLSATASATSSVLPVYNTGLIQNFTFKDNNIGTVSKFMFESWVDVNYSNVNQTNLYQDGNYYDAGNAFSTNTILSKANLNGFITYDVLSSNSSMRNGFDLNSKVYKLGTKYTKYVDYLDQVSEFNELFSNENAYSSLGMNNFTNDNWSVKSTMVNFISRLYTNSGYDISNISGYDDGALDSGFSPATASLASLGTMKFYPNAFHITNVDTTLNIQTSNKITIGTYSLGAPYTTEYTWNQLMPGGTSDLHNYIILNNENTKNIPLQRYSIAEYTVLSYTGYPGPKPFTARSIGSTQIPPSLNYGILPAAWSLCPQPSSPLFDPNPVKKEYFYNRHSLLLQIFSSDYQGIGAPPIAYADYPFKIQFDNIHFYEVDMIPFFQYTTASNVDSSIKIPWTSIAPYIDYSNSNFNYIGNITLTVDGSIITSSASTVLSLPTSGGIFSISNDSASSAALG